MSLCYDISSWFVCSVSSITGHADHPARSGFGSAGPQSALLSLHHPHLPLQQCQ